MSKVTPEEIDFAVRQVKACGMDTGAQRRVLEVIDALSKAQTEAEPEKKSK